MAPSRNLFNLTRFLCDKDNTAAIGRFFFVEELEFSLKFATVIQALRHRTNGGQAHPGQ